MAVNFDPGDFVELDSSTVFTLPAGASSFAWNRSTGLPDRFSALTLIGSTSLANLVDSIRIKSASDLVTLPSLAAIRAHASRFARRDIDSSATAWELRFDHPVTHLRGTAEVRDVTEIQITTLAGAQNETVRVAWTVYHQPPFEYRLLSIGQSISGAVTDTPLVLPPLARPVRAFGVAVHSNYTRFRFKNALRGQFIDTRKEALLARATSQYGVSSTTFFYNFDDAGRGRVIDPGLFEVLVDTSGAISSSIFIETVG